MNFVKLDVVFQNYEIVKRIEKRLMITGVLMWVGVECKLHTLGRPVEGNWSAVCVVLATFLVDLKLFQNRLFNKVG